MPFRDCDDGLSLNSCCVILCCVCLFVFISLEMIDESGRRLAKGGFFSTQRVEQRPESPSLEMIDESWILIYSRRMAILPQMYSLAAIYGQNTAIETYFAANIDDTTGLVCDLI